MKLEYKVLWFEDQFEEVQGDLDRVKALVREYGFEPNFVQKSEAKEADIELLSTQLESYNPYDIIIFDYNLGQENIDGLNIATLLRQRIYTDMVFYSGKRPDELRKLLFDEGVDGVFIVHRDTFFDDIEPIIEDHIKRMSDMNNVRGVVMSATSAIEHELRDILKFKLSNLDSSELSEFSEKLAERLQKDLSAKIEKIKKSASIADVVLDHSLTTFENIRVSLQGLYKDDLASKTLVKNESLIHSVQRERNNLAHQKEELTDDGKMLLCSDKGSKEYNFEEFKRIRNNLLLVKQHIQSLKS